MPVADSNIVDLLDIPMDDVEVANELDEYLM